MRCHVRVAQTRAELPVRTPRAADGRAADLAARARAGRRSVEAVVPAAPAPAPGPGPLMSLASFKDFAGLTPAELAKTLAAMAKQREALARRLSPA